MNGVLLLITGGIYLTVGINFYLQGNKGLAIAYMAYSVSNYGLWLSSGRLG